MKIIFISLYFYLFNNLSVISQHQKYISADVTADFVNVTFSKEGILEKFL